MMTSGKADRKSLPPPRRRSGRARGRPGLCRARRPRRDRPGRGAGRDPRAGPGLGGQPLLRRPGRELTAGRPLLRPGPATARELAAGAMKDVYLNPTIRSLAAALSPSYRVLAARRARPGAGAGAARRHRAVRLRAGSCSCWPCSASVFLARGGCVDSGCGWVWPAAPARRAHLPAVAGLQRRGLLACSAACRSLAKWTLIGRWKPREIPVWSLRYLRFWAVKTLIRANPLAMFAGSPLYLLYLRALGAKIGRGVVDLLQDRAGLHRHAHHRRRHRDPQRNRRSPATGPRPASSGPARSRIGKERARRRGIPCWTSTPPSATGLSSGTPRPCTNPRPFPTASAGTDPPPSAPTWTTAPSIRFPPARCAGQPTAPSQLLSLIFVTMPLAIGAGVAVLTRLPAVASLASLGAGRCSRWRASTSRARSCPRCCSSARILIGAAVVVHGAACPAPVHHTRPRLSALRPAPLGAPRRSGGSPTSLLPRTHRRQLLRRRPTCGSRLPAARLRTDRLELRRGPGARDPVRHRHRTGHDGLRRRHPHQRRLLQHIVPRDTDCRSGRTASSETRSPTRRRPDRRELPDRHQGHGAPRRAGPGNTGLLGSPCFEIPRSVTSDARFDHLRTGGVPPPAAAPRTGTTSTPWGCSWPCGGYTPSSSRCSPWRRGNSTVASEYSCSPGLTVATLLFSLAYFITVERALMRIQVSAAAVLLHLRPVLLVARALLETDGAPHRHAQRHPVQEPGLAPGRRPDRPAGLRRRVLHRRADTCRRSATTARSTQAPSSNATRWRTAFSRPTTPSWKTAAPSAPGPSSTTA